jgi:hypothetical protein
MSTLVEGDIGRRALLDIVTPAAQTVDSAAVTGHRKKQKFRLKKRPHDEAPPTVDVPPRPTHITIVERLSSESVSVCWSDARLGRYSDQTWRLGRARIDSLCLLTGRRIRYGDKIFRPRTQQGYLSPEYNRMILACVVDDFVAPACQQIDTHWAQPSVAQPSSRLRS